MNRKLMSKVMLAALLEIRDNCGDVCEEFDACEHLACKSSYDAWVIADAVLNLYGVLNGVDDEN
jgi:hypothetical protein